jgi:hypothetical protein
LSSQVQVHKMHNKYKQPEEENEVQHPASGLLEKHHFN